MLFGNNVKQLLNGIEEKKDEFLSEAEYTIEKHSPSWKSYGEGGYGRISFQFHNKGLNYLSIDAEEGYEKSSKRVMVSLTPAQVRHLVKFLKPFASKKGGK